MHLPSSLENLAVGAKFLKFSVVSGKIIRTELTLSETVKIELETESGSVQKFEFPDTAPVKDSDVVAIVMVSINGSGPFPICVNNLTSKQERHVEFNHVQQLHLVSKPRIYFLSLLTGLVFVYLTVGVLLVSFVWNELSMDYIQKNIAEIISGFLFITVLPMLYPRFWRGIQKQYERRLKIAQINTMKRREQISAWIKESILA